MPRALDEDLRLRVVAYQQKHGSSRTELAEIFGIGEATAYRWVARFKQLGSVARFSSHVNRPPPLILDEQLEDLKVIVEEKRDRTLEELCQVWLKKGNGKVSLSTMHRAVLRAGFSIKKNRREHHSEKGMTS